MLQLAQKEEVAPKEDLLLTGNLKKMMVKDYHVYSKQKIRPVAKLLIKFAVYLKRHHIGLPEALCLPIYSQPHFHSHSKEFFINARQLNLQRCSELLVQDNILVHQIDFMGKTALHWAVLKKSPALLQLVLGYHADPEVLDFTGKSALTYAVENDDEVGIKVVAIHKILLDHRTTPWRDSNMDYIEYSKNFWTKKLLIFYRRV